MGLDDEVARGRGPPGDPVDRVDGGLWRGVGDVPAETEVCHKRGVGAMEGRLWGGNVDEREDLAWSQGGGEGREALHLEVEAVADGQVSDRR